MSRRIFLTSIAASTLAIAVGISTKKSLAKAFEISYSESEWKSRLSPLAFKVLRKQGTERPFSSPLLHEKRAGTFNCAGCDLAVYSSKTKFDSGTGWPSFWEALPRGVGYSEDNAFFTKRTEVHCHRCGGHLGHVFEDGPKPTGKRHCINGVALNFKPT